VSAELEARRTAAAAVLADYQREAETVDVAERAVWGALLAVDAAVWALWLAWHLVPWLLIAAAVVVAGKRRQLRRRVLAWLGASAPAGPVIAGKVVADDAKQLRAELAHVRGQVARLEDAANRPIETVIASYERIGRQYGPAGVGKTEGRR
jgi:hypothetical protein